MGAKELEIPTNGSKYTNDIRTEAAVLFATKGTAAAVSRAMGIPETTLCAWRKEEWWERIVEEVRSQNKDKRIAQYEQIMDQAHEMVIDKLPEASARDAMIIMATAQDKGRILQALPNNYNASQGDTEALAKRFAELSEQWEEKQANVISVQDGKQGD